MSAPVQLIWKNEKQPPLIGSTVKVRVNSIGDAVVLAYFAQDGYLGVKVLPVAAPEWYVKQNGKDVSCYVFGPEMSY